MCDLHHNAAQQKHADQNIFPRHRWPTLQVQAPAQHELMINLKAAQGDLSHSTANAPGLGSLAMSSFPAGAPICDARRELPDSRGQAANMMR